MRGWVWCTVLGIHGLAACGGRSERHAGGGDGDGSSVGGTGGSSGGSAGTGTSKGGTSSSTGGRGGTTGARGGAAGRGGSSSGGDGANAGAPSTGGNAGASGAPTCDLAGGVTCSFDESCTALGCGTAWSSYDENRCVRADCAWTGVCEAGERCVVAPVGGGFDDPCGNESDSCDVTASGCECLRYEECFPSAVCLPIDEFPPENDCPIAELDCDELSRAAETLQGYLDGTAFLEPYEPPGNLQASLEACAALVAQRFMNRCED